MGFSSGLNMDSNSLESFHRSRVLIWNEGHPIYNSSAAWLESNGYTVNGKVIVPPPPPEPTSSPNQETPRPFDPRDDVQFNPSDVRRRSRQSLRLDPGVNSST